MLTFILIIGKIMPDKIVENRVCVISNFYINEALGTLKPVSSKYFINFSPTTVLEAAHQQQFLRLLMMIS